MRADGLHLDYQLGDAVLDFRVIRHRSGQADRFLRLQVLDDQLAHPRGEAVIDVAKVDERPREEAQHEHVDAGGAGRNDGRDVLVGHERAVEDRVVAARRAHAQHVPGVLDGVAAGRARHERMDDFRRVRIAGIQTV